MPKQEWPLEMGREAALAAERVAGSHAELISELEARATACETMMALMGPGPKDAGTPLPDLLRQAAAALAAAPLVAGEDDVDAAAKRIVASRNLPAGCEINWEQFKADARAALALPTPDNEGDNR